VVLAIGSARQRTLARLGLELSGEFEVVGTAVDERDVEFIVGSLRPDVVLIDLPSPAGGHNGLPVVAVARRAWAGTVPVLYEALVARHHADTGATTPRPIELARLLCQALNDHAPALVCASG
jgi:hypothetical protein